MGTARALKGGTGSDMRRLKPNLDDGIGGQQTKWQMLLTYFRLISIYVVFGVGGILMFMYFCALARGNAGIAALNDLTLKIGRTAYLYTHASSQYVCGRYDPELSYVLETGDCRFNDTEFDIRISANSLGLRDDESSLDSPEIVILGDSHAMGTGVDQEKIFPALIEEASGLKVLNTGMSSYGTARQVGMLRRLSVESADQIIIQYSRNDFEENKAYRSLGGELNTMSEEKYETLRKTDLDRYDSFFGPGVGVVSRAVEKFSEFMDTTPNEPLETVSEAEAFGYVLSRNLDLFKNKSIIILEVNGHNKYSNMFIENVEKELEGFDIDIQYVDVRQVLTNNDYYVLDNHMTAAGHEKVADLILQAIGAGSTSGTALSD